jgi:Zinc finger, C3HC4 type (RING finger)/Inhibitor of Apoptosis domain
MNSNGKGRKKKVEVEVKFPTKNRFPKYADESKRQESFRNWPVIGSIDRRKMVAVGLFYFYTEGRDIVSCFSCGSQYENPRLGDKLWKRHEFGYKTTCGFLKYLKYMRMKKRTAVKSRNARKDASKDEGKDEGKDDGKLCKICLHFEYNILLKPCKHVVVCSKCVEKIEKCPYCRADLIGFEQIFLT